MKKKATVNILLTIQLILLGLIIATITIPAFEDFLESIGMIAMIWFGGLFALIGFAVTYLGFKEQEKNVRKILILSGLSSGGTLIFAVLHNLFYAFAELTQDIPVLPIVINGLEVASFLLAIPILPIAFVITAIIYFIKTTKD